MTLRDLLKNLQAQDEKALDQHVLVSPPAPSGGYAGIDRVSNLYPGNVVLHMMDAEINREGERFDCGCTA